VGGWQKSWHRGYRNGEAPVGSDDWDDFSRDWLIKLILKIDFAFRRTSLVSGSKNCLFPGFHCHLVRQIGIFLLRYYSER
jgi:hypothetical protein